MFDPKTKQAIRHTLHCLVGCGIGETLGSAIGAIFFLPNAAQTGLAVGLAFFFGYMFTYIGARKAGLGMRRAAYIAIATDTVSITSMEIVDNALIWLIPGAIHAQVTSWLFWWSLAVSLAVAFAVTVPINRFVISRGQHHHH